MPGTDRVGVLPIRFPPPRDVSRTSASSSAVHRGVCASASLRELTGPVKRALILSPAFVADCLEDVEELEIRGALSFRAAGGEEPRVVPAVDAGDRWADGVIALAREASAWLHEAPIGEPAS